MNMIPVFQLTSPARQAQPNRTQVPPPMMPPNPDLRFLEANETFRSCIQAFVKRMEANVPEEYSIAHLLVTFHIQKRRMYDVTSVFTMIGSCEKLSVDLIRWVGLSKIPPALQKMQFEAGVPSSDISLDTIIGSCDLVSISTLTIRFLLCFLALRMTTLDIRKISRYLSRKTGRRKSTLCKLYQIAHILEAAEVLSRSDAPGQITLVEQFFVPVDISVPSVSRNPIGPFSIEAILNHDNPIQEQVVQARRQEFFTELAKASSDGDRPPVPRS